MKPDNKIIRLHYWGGFFNPAFLLKILINNQLNAPMLCPICQRYNLKAIHNKVLADLQATHVVPNMSKIQFESYSQHSYHLQGIQWSCAQYVKDTI